MRNSALDRVILLVVPLAAGCARAGAQTSVGAAAPPSTVIGAVAGDCPADAGPLRPDPADVMADRNGDGYVCTLQIRSIAGDTLRLAVDNDTPALGIQPEPYIGM
jgi:hypothetical protein